DCYKFSRGQAIFGSGTRFPPVEVQGRTRCCEATKITDHLFMEAAQAVANSLDKVDIESDSVLPNTARIRDVGHNVATAVVLAAQKAQNECLTKLQRLFGNSTTGGFHCLILFPYYSI
ncbi:NAD-dependent malic enzyme (NAD-ME), partial [Durusdinium trenchii]